MPGACESYRLREASDDSFVLTVCADEKPYRRIIFEKAKRAIIAAYSHRIVRTAKTIQAFEMQPWVRRVHCEEGVCNTGLLADFRRQALVAFPKTAVRR